MVPNHIRPENHGRKDLKGNTMKAGPTLSAPWLDMNHQSLFNLANQSQMSSQSKLTTGQTEFCQGPSIGDRGLVPRVDFSILCFELQEDRHLEKVRLDVEMW